MGFEPTTEATGMIFNPVNPAQFVVNVQHPASVDLDNVPDGFGDAVWHFDVSGTDKAIVRQLRRAGRRHFVRNLLNTLKCVKAMKEQMTSKKGNAHGFRKS